MDFNLISENSHFMAKARTVPQNKKREAMIYRFDDNF